MAVKKRHDRVPGYKLLEEKIVHTEQGSLKLRIMVATSDKDRMSRFLAVHAEHNVHIVGEDLASVITQGRELLVQRTSMKWEPWLYLTVTATALVTDPELELWSKHGRANLHFYGRAIDQLSLSITAVPVELGEHNGAKRHRFAAPERELRTNEGWPSVSAEKARRWGSDPDSETNALVPDTPENRAAIEALRLGMHHLHAKLAAMLHPDHAAELLPRLAARMLPSGGDT